MLDEFNHWMSGTAVSLAIQKALWIIPAVQTVHILAVGAVLSSMAMFDLRLLGVAGRRHSIASLSQRFMPWLWGALLVLAASGGLLIVGEPDRALGNPMFLAKMLMLGAAIALTLIFGATLNRDLARGASDLSSSHHTAAKCIGLLSLVLWVAIAVAGQWIAYAG